MELLATIAIVAVLASLLLGALASSQRKAQQAGCLNNLRQLGAATISYCQDNEGDMPYAWDRANPDASANNFLAQLKPLLYSEQFDGYFDFEYGVFACPTRLREPIIESGNPFRVSYGMNASNTMSGGFRRRLSHVAQPARTLLIADVNYQYNHVAISRDTPAQIGYKHGESAVILYFDGHVSPRSLGNPSELVIGF